MSEEVQTDAPVVEDVEVEAEAETNAIDNEEKAEQQDAEPSESSTEKQEEEPEKKEKSSFQERIDELTGKYRDTERDRDYWKLQAEEAKRQPKPEPLTPGKTLADFDYDETKFSEYVLETAKQQALDVAKQETAREQQIRKQAEFQSKETIFAEEHADYQTVTRAPDLRVTPEMVAVIQGSEKGAELLYNLGQNKAVAAHLAGLAPLDMARELGRLEADLSRPAKKEPSITKAPPPPPKVKGTGSVTEIKATDANSDKLSTDEWFKRRQKQIAKR